MKPYHEGQRAFKNPRFTKGPNGFKVLEENPYREGTKDYDDWEYGFDRAYFENREGSTNIPA